MLQNPGIGAYTPNPKGPQPLCTPQNNMPSSVPWQCWIFDAYDCWSCTDIMANAAQNAVIYPTLTQGAPLPPPSTPAVPAGYGTTAAPYDCAANPAGDPSCPGYDAAIAAVTAQQSAAQKAAASAQMQQTADQIRADAQANCPNQTLIDNGDGTFSCPNPILGVPTWVWLAGGGVVAAALLMSRGGR